MALDATDGEPCAEGRVTVDRNVCRVHREHGAFTIETTSGAAEALWSLGAAQRLRALGCLGAVRAVRAVRALGHLNPGPRCLSYLAVMGNASAGGRRSRAKAKNAFSHAANVRPPHREEPSPLRRRPHGSRTPKLTQLGHSYDQNIQILTCGRHTEIPNRKRYQNRIFKKDIRRILLI